MRIWKKLLIGLLVLSVIMVTGLILFATLVDPNDYRGAIADLVDEFTGRDLEIAGDLRIRVLPTPSVEAHDVTFSNASWASEPDMVRAKRARAEFALLPLLKGSVVVHRVVAIEPEVFLEVDAEGRPNWVFEDGGEEPASSGETTDTRAPDRGVDVAIREIQIENGVLDFLDEQVGARVIVGLEKLVAGTKRPGGHVQLSMKGAYQDLPVALDGNLGVPGAILQNQPIEFDLKGTAGEAEFTLQGAVGKPLQGRDLRLDVTLKSGSTKSITDAVGVQLEEFGPVDLKARLLEEDGHFHLDPVAISVRPRETDATMNGSLKNVLFSLDGEHAQGKPAKVDVEGTFGEAKYAVAGDVGKPMEGKDLRLQVKVDAKATRPLTELAGVDVEEVGPVSLKLTVIEKGGRFDLDDVDVTARPRSADVAVKGSVANVIDDPRPDVSIVLSADTLRQLDPTLPEAGPVSISAKLRPKDKVIEVRDLVARVGKSDLSGSATIDAFGELPSASAKLHAGVLDLAELVPAAEGADTPAVEEKSETASDATRDKAGSAEDVKPTGRKIFSDAPLPFDVLKKANVSIELAVDKLITRQLTLDKVDVAARLDDGNLTIKPAAHVAGGKVGGTIDIDTRAQPAKFSAAVDAKKVSIGALTKEIRGYETSRGLESGLAMKLQGQGNSVRDLMSGLNGDVRLEVGEGRLKNDVLDKVGADLLTQIIGIAVPKDAEDDTTQLKCGVVRFAVVDGDAIADQTIVLETDKVLVKGGGLVDLKTEELDLGAKLAARQGIRIGAGTLSSLAKLQGTLAEPQLGTDLTGVVKVGAKVGIAFVTAGLSLVAEGVYGHLSEDEHPCQTALARQMKVTPKEYKEQKTAEEN